MYKCQMLPIAVPQAYFKVLKTIKLLSLFGKIRNQEFHPWY